MLKKFFILLKILSNLELKKFNLLKKKFIIFDVEGSKSISVLLPSRTFFILTTRAHQIKKIYYSKKIIFNFLRFFILQRKKILNSYLLSMIEEIKPIKIITFVDNSQKFSEISKTLEKKFEFIAIQNAARQDHQRHRYEFKKKIRSTDLSKNFYIPNFFTYGQHEIDDYKKHNIYVGKSKIIGSLRLMHAIEYFKKKKIKIKKNKFDICLIGDDGHDLEKLFQIKNIESDYSLLSKYTLKYCIENKKKFVFAWKRDNKYKHAHSNEYNYFKKHLEKKEFDFLVKNSLLKETSSYSSYKCILQSKVAVSVASSMLREKLSMRGRILTSNYTSF